MSTQILCVGKMKDKPYRQMADEYLKRLGRYGKYEEIEVPDLPEPASGGSDAAEEKIRAREGEEILAKIRPGDRVIALTIPGKRRSSEELARHLADLKTAGVSRTVFVIGGSLGLGRTVLERADEEMSMSPMTSCTGRRRSTPGNGTTNEREKGGGPPFSRPGFGYCARNMV